MRSNLIMWAMVLSVGCAHAVAPHPQTSESVSAPASVSQLKAEATHSIDASLDGLSITLLKPSIAEHAKSGELVPFAAKTSGSCAVRSLTFEIAGEKYPLNAPPWVVLVPFAKAQAAACDWDVFAQDVCGHGTMKGITRIDCDSEALRVR